jgi:hypothetical protein
MKQILTSFKILLNRAARLGNRLRQHAEQRKIAAVAAGFHLIVPKTAAQQKLRALPHDTVTMVHYNGKIYYVFPDPAHHNQAYVGGPAQYETYRQLRLKQREQVEAAEMTDASTDWGFGASGLGPYSGRIP